MMTVDLFVTLPFTMIALYIGLPIVSTAIHKGVKRLFR